MGVALEGNAVAGDRAAPTDGDVLYYPPDHTFDGAPQYERCYTDLRACGWPSTAVAAPAPPFPATPLEALLVLPVPSTPRDLPRLTDAAGPETRREVRRCAADRRDQPFGHVRVVYRLALPEIDPAHPLALTWTAAQTVTDAILAALLTRTP